MSKRPSAIAAIFLVGATTWCSPTSWFVGNQCVAEEPQIRSNRSNAATFVQPTDEDRLSDPVYLSWVREEEVSDCVRCHLAPSRGDAFADKQIFGTFVRSNEMERWLTLDKHTIARRRIEPFLAKDAEQQYLQLYSQMQQTVEEILPRLAKSNSSIDVDKIGMQSIPENWIGKSNLLSRRICDKVFGNASVETESGYELFRDACLTCHGGYRNGEAGFSLADVNDGSAQIGIDCNHCHAEWAGDEQVSDDWIVDHQVAKKWRLLPPEQKSAAGMADMPNTAVQAKMCLNCHVGNRDLGHVCHARNVCRGSSAVAISRVAILLRTNAPALAIARSTFRLDEGFKEHA